MASWNLGACGSLSSIQPWHCPSLVTVHLRQTSFAGGPICEHLYLGCGRQTSVKDNGHQSQRTNDVSCLRGHRSFFHLIAKADGMPWYSKVVHSERYRSHCPLWRVSILLRRKEILGSLCILNLYSKYISLYFQKSYAIKTDFVSKHL